MTSTDPAFPSSTHALESARVLMVDDDRDLCQAVCEYLQRQGVTVASEHDGEHLLSRIEAFRPDLIILDVMLPGRDGFEVCRALRAHDIKLPILMMTAKDEVFDQLLGLELGADTYLAKPVLPRVLLAHIRAAIRRTKGSLSAMSPEQGATNSLRFGKLLIDGVNREVTLANERIKLSTAEFDLLWLLASNAGQVLSRDDILRELRGLRYASFDRSIDARLYRLRKRFEPSHEATHKIKTVRPHGYMFCLDDW
jgi:two-component system, OmpR family, response regulator